MIRTVDEIRDLTCSAPNCEKTRPGHRDATIAQMYARASGWHAWTGKTLGGESTTVILCPAHAHGMGQRNKPEPYDEPMF